MLIVKRLKFCNLGTVNLNYENLYNVGYLIFQEQPVKLVTIS